MKVTAATFVACVTSKEGMPEKKLPVFALVGRSNVGKSSLINVLAGRRELAKTSSTPGKTLTINFYLFNEAFYLVDLPGYGYSKASKITRERIQKMMNEFFESIDQLAGIVQILDLRHPPSNMDMHMLQWIKDQGFRYLPVFTKSDKLGASEVARMRKLIQSKINASWAVTFSSKTRQGREELLSALEQFMSNTEIGHLRQIEKPGRNQKTNQRRKFSGAPRRPDQENKGTQPNPPAQGPARNTPLGGPQGEGSARNTRLGAPPGEGSGKPPGPESQKNPHRFNRHHRFKKKVGNPDKQSEKKGSLNEPAKNMGQKPPQNSSSGRES